MRGLSYWYIPLRCINSAMFRIRFDLCMDLDQAFYLNTAPDPDLKTKSIKSKGF
jgi:hypothetical protein